MLSNNKPERSSFIRALNKKHDQLAFIKLANKTLEDHQFCDEAISHSSLIEDNDISRDEIVLGFDTLEPTVILNKEDIKILAQAIGLQVFDVNDKE